MSNRGILATTAIGALLGLTAPAGPLLAQETIDKELLGTPTAPLGPFDLKLALPEAVRISKGHRGWKEPLGDFLPSADPMTEPMPGTGQAAPETPDVQKVPSMAAPTPSPAAPATQRPRTTPGQAAPPAAAR